FDRSISLFISIALPYRSTLFPYTTLFRSREVEFGRDLLGIERKVDDSNVVTALIGLGPEREDGTRLEVFVEDEEALQRWGIPNPQTGELMHLIETYEPESTDQDMTIARLTELTRNELEKRINSVVEYTADVADLEKVPGMENKIIRFGDTIKIKRSEEHTSELQSRENLVCR